MKMSLFPLLADHLPVSVIFFLFTTTTRAKPLKFKKNLKKEMYLFANKIIENGAKISGESKITVFSFLDLFLLIHTVYLFR